jgi:catechol 2,3-dioxygenase-like lactoylglutathione lyase family enzyme
MDQVGDELAGLLDGSPYHVGIVVPDIDQAMATYGHLFGVEWGQRMGSTMAAELDGVPHQLDLDAVYSKNGPVRIELCKEIPGTVWTAGAGIHHIGFWCDDVVGAGARLIDAGYPLAAALFMDRSQPRFMALHRGPQGLFVELVSSAIRPFMEPLWA